jgi:hypothetical protein
MTSSTLELLIPAIRSVTVTRSTLTFEVEDGRSVSVPLEWYPRLRAGSVKERANWVLIGAGYGVHWPDLDEDISIEALLAGRRSLESERSFLKWLEQRPKRRGTPN